jgi:hypothetical protein
MVIENLKIQKIVSQISPLRDASVTSVEMTKRVGSGFWRFSNVDFRDGRTVDGARSNGRTIYE